MDPLDKYVSNKSPVTGSKNAEQCSEPQPVINLRFLPMASSSASSIYPLGNASASWPPPQPQPPLQLQL